MKIPTDAPKKIFLQHDPEKTGEPFDEAAEVTWCRDRINETDIAYVRSDVRSAASRNAVLEDVIEALEARAKDLDALARRGDEGAAYEVDWTRSLYPLIRALLAKLGEDK